MKLPEENDVPGTRECTVHEQVRVKRPLRLGLLDRIDELETQKVAGELLSIRKQVLNAGLLNGSILTKTDPENTEFVGSVNGTNVVSKLKLRELLESQRFHVTRMIFGLSLPNPSLPRRLLDEDHTVTELEVLPMTKTQLPFSSDVPVISTLKATAPDNGPFVLEELDTT